MQKLCQSEEILDCPKFSKKIRAWSLVRGKTCCQIDSNLLRFGFSRLDLADWSQVILRFKSPILTRPEVANERSSATRKLCSDEAPFAAFRGWLFATLVWVFSRAAAVEFRIGGYGAVDRWLFGNRISEFIFNGSKIWVVDFVSKFIGVILQIVEFLKIIPISYVSKSCSWDSVGRSAFTGKVKWGQGRLCPHCVGVC